MLNALLSQTAAGTVAETERHAYNAAFEELGLSWHWDATTYARLQAHGRQAVRVYLETEQPHLLRAYEADFLVNAIETAQARSRTSMGGTPAVSLPSRNGAMGEEPRTRNGAAWSAAVSASHGHGSHPHHATSALS